MAEEKVGLLHQKDALKSLAKQLREEADRAEARAKRLEEGVEKVGCESGCWNLLSTCIQIQPI